MEHVADPAEHMLTQRDLDHVPEDGNRYEVIDGELHMTPFPGFAHQYVISQLMVILGSFAQAQGLGRVFPPGLKVVLDEPTGVGPDLVYVSEPRMDDMRADGYYGAPDLVIEVLSSKPMLDRYVKHRKYASAGIAHYWIADPESRILEVFRLEGARYRRVAELKSGDTFEPELFPGLKLETSELWP